MGYTDGLLATGERIILREHQHPFVLIWDSRGGLVGLVVAVLLVVLRSAANLTGSAADIVGYIAIALVVVALLLLLWSWLKFRSEEFVVTTRRIIHAQGVINKEASDSALEKINDAILKESLFGRMFGFGDLEVDTASESGIERLRMLRDAKAYKKAMLDAKNQLDDEGGRPTFTAASQPPAPAMPSAPAAPMPAAHMSGDEVASAVDRLGELRDKGLITPEEFEAKKKDLLDRL